MISGFWALVCAEGTWNVMKLAWSQEKMWKVVKCDYEKVIVIWDLKLNYFLEKMQDKNVGRGAKYHHIKSSGWKYNSAVRASINKHNEIHDT